MWEVRVSTRERQAYADRLADAYAEGRIDYGEFHARHEALFQAKTHGDAQLLFDGLPKPEVRLAPATGFQYPRPTPTAAPPSRWRLSLVKALAIAAVGVVATMGTVWAVFGLFETQESTAIYYGEGYEPVYAEPISQERLDAFFSYADSEGFGPMVQLAANADVVRATAWSSRGELREIIMGDDGSVTGHAADIDEFGGYSDPKAMREAEPSMAIDFATIQRGIENAKDYVVKEWGMPAGTQPTHIDVYGDTATIAFRDGYVMTNPDGTVQSAEQYG